MGDSHVFPDGLACWSITCIAPGLLCPQGWIPDREPDASSAPDHQRLLVHATRWYVGRHVRDLATGGVHH